MKAMISRRRVTADLIIQLLLFGSAFLLFFKSGQMVISDGMLSFFYSSFLGGWWLAPIFLLVIWQFIYNKRLNRYFRYPLRLRLNYIIIAVFIAKIAAFFFSEGALFAATVNFAILLTVLTGFIISGRDYISRVYWPKPFWQLR